MKTIIGFPFSPLTLRACGQVYKAKHIHISDPIGTEELQEYFVSAQLLDDSQKCFWTGAYEFPCEVGATVNLFGSFEGHSITERNEHLSY